MTSRDKQTLQKKKTEAQKELTRQKINESSHVE